MLVQGPRRAPLDAASEGPPVGPVAVCAIEAAQVRRVASVVRGGEAGLKLLCTHAGVAHGQ